MIRPARRDLVLTTLLALLLAPGLPAQQQQEPPSEEPAAEQQEAPAEGAPAAQQEPPAEGETPAETAPEATRPALIDVTEVAARAETASKTLDRIEAEVKRPEEVKAAANKLQELNNGMAQAAVDARLTLEATNSLTAVDEVRGTWTDTKADLEKLQLTFDGRAEFLKTSLTEIDTLSALWQQSTDAFGPDAPAAAVSRARNLLDRAQELRERVLAARDQIVSEQSRAAEASASIDNVLSDASATERRLQRRLLSADAPPLWKLLGQPDLDLSLEPARSEFTRRVQSLINYARNFQGALLGEAAFVLAIVVMLLVLRRPAREWVRDDPSMATSMALLRRPVATALLVAILLRPLLHERSPIGLNTVHYLLGVGSVYFVLSVMLKGRARKGLIFVSVLSLLDIARGFLWNAPLLERGVFVVEALLATITVIALLRLPAPDGKPEPATIRTLEWAALLTLLTALFCLTVGYLGLGRLLTKGVIVSAWGAFAFVAAHRALTAVIYIALQTRTMNRLRMVSRHRYTIRQRVRRVVRILVWLAFASFVLNTFSLRNLVFEGISDLVSTPLEVGSLSVSLGDVLAFGFVLWISFQISRFLRFLFEEDIATRLKLPRGVPYAASAALHYVILFLGFIVAVQAAGVDMGRFAIIGGALGVGVGFGLQNVVNNFVSGLILLFERPIQVGDTVEVGTVFGIVRRIGIRSSTVRTWDGAEVIVPNGDLISNQVTNWTLSDMQRRVTIPIGVAYGTDPDRVIELLLDLASKNTEVIADPAPQALFVGHGDSSLNFELRAWTVAESPVGLKSDLTRAVNRALAEADIEIPFPQRDLHLRSSDVNLGSGESGPSDGAEADAETDTDAQADKRPDTEPDIQPAARSSGRPAIIEPPSEVTEDEPHS